MVSVATPSPLREAPRKEVRDSLLAVLEQALERSSQHILGLQQADGHWCGELEGDTILESEYLLLLHFLGRGNSDRAQKAREHLRRQQRAEGGWSIYPGGSADLSASVKGYFVLKLAGEDPESVGMQRTRAAILEAGGLDACNSFTKLYLSIFGVYEWSRAPVVPPELIRLPRWFPVNIWEMSSWSRAIVVPLSIIWALKPSCPVEPRHRIDELRAPRKPAPEKTASLRIRSWSVFFRFVDRAVKVAEALGLLRPLRRGSLRLCEEWVLARLERSGGLAAIFPSILNTVIALRALGYDEDDPTVAAQLLELERLEIEESETLRVQPCFSPVWDTALAMGALRDAGVEGAPLERGVAWLLDKEVRLPGDWRVKNPEGPIGGWYFEYENEFYPDCDDTAEVLAFLGSLEATEPQLEQERRGAVDRGVGWLLSMQNEDGGWGAFDRGCNRELLTLVPFADHNAMIDPSTADVTARSVEALVANGFDRYSAPIERGLACLREMQEADGSWYGRWGANYIYGTWLALQAFGAVGDKAFGSHAQETVVKGARWLLSCQNQDGGWGESLRSYDDPNTKGQGRSTASQTAWAIMGLLAAGACDPLPRSEADQERAREALRRAARFLIDKQQVDGSWTDEEWTGTGFPSVFYLRYHYYALYFPLQALAHYKRAIVEQAVASQIA